MCARVSNCKDYGLGLVDTVNAFVMLCDASLCYNPPQTLSQSGSVKMARICLSSFDFYLRFMLFFSRLYKD